MKNEKTKGYVVFPPKYSENIYSEGMGLYIHKSSDLTLLLDIMHNIPLQAYNFDRKSHIDLSLLSVVYNPKLIEQAVDIVMESFKIRNGYPEEITKTDIIVHSKKDLFNAVMSNKKEIYVVIPKSKPSAKEESDFYSKMADYFYGFIIPFVKRKSLSTFWKILKVLK